LIEEFQVRKAWRY